MKQPAPLVELQGLAVTIDAALPQTQCTRCGFDGCAPYAVALAAGEAGINRCPPGGSETIAALASLLHTPVLPLDTTRGETTPRRVARIVEPLCIGCTLCIQACPVDAIVGAPKRMHAVIEAHCTGCDLCLPPCPVDCIEMVEHDGHGERLPPWTPADADAARHRTRARAARLHRLSARGRVAPTRGLPVVDADGASPDTVGDHSTDAEARRRAIVDAAIARARQRLARRAPPV